MPQDALQHYLTRFHGQPASIDAPPSPRLRGVIVIPCFLEPDWKQTLTSLCQCEPTEDAFEVIIVLNASAAAPASTKAEQLRTCQAMQAFLSDHQASHLQFHILVDLELKPKHAGVGWARKIGMDEALHRLERAGRLDTGFIVGLDADCTCETNYLRALASHFSRHPRTPGCSLHFEHPMSGDLPDPVYLTACRYELHLRYYIEALRYAGFPNAFHTIGSSMAVRAPVYMAQGGMNRRKAGEDFYFLHKIIPQGNFTELNTTTVKPSPRPSERVPFGTGRAVIKHLNTSSFPTYPWEAVLDLKQFFHTATAPSMQASLVSSRAKNPAVPRMMQSYLDAVDGWQSWQDCIDATSNHAAYLRRFFQWFDGFQCMKFMHHARDTSYGEMEIHQAVNALMQAIGMPMADGDASSPIETLKLLRKHQRQGWSPPPFTKWSNIDRTR